MVKAQSSLEFMLIAAAIMVLSVAAVSGTNSQLQMSRNFSDNASLALGLSTSSLISSLSAGPGSFYPTPALGEVQPELSLEVYAPTMYVGQPAMVQAVLWNYGRVSVYVIEFSMYSSDDDALPFSLMDKPAFTLGLSNTITATATPKTPGTFEIIAFATTADGTVIEKAINVTVLRSSGSAPSQLVCSLTLERQNERLAYDLLDNRTVYNATSTYRNLDGCIPELDPHPERYCYPERAAWFSKCWYSNTGYLKSTILCVYLNKTATAAQISQTPRYVYSLAINITNTTNASLSGILSQNIPQANLSGAGTASLTGTFSGSGPNPAIDAIALMPDGVPGWQLSSMSSYNDYRYALASFNSFMATCNTTMGDIGCWNGYASQINAFNSKVAALLGGNVPPYSGCLISNATALCNATAFIYPTLSIRLDSQFLGTPIYASSPAKQIASGITAEISTD